MFMVVDWVSVVDSIDKTNSIQFREESKTKWQFARMRWLASANPNIQLPRIYPNPSLTNSIVSELKLVWWMSCLLKRAVSFSPRSWYSSPPLKATESLLFSFFTSRWIMFYQNHVPIRVAQETTTNYYTCCIPSSWAKEKEKKLSTFSSRL